MMLPVRFNVYGLPIPQGSKTPGITKPKPGAKPKPYLRDANDAVLRPWRQEVASCAASAVAASGQGMFTGPVRASMLFRFPMPRSRPQWCREAGVVLMDVAPDLDKLVRAIGDACKTGGLLRDDAIISLALVGKFEIHDAWTGVSVQVEALDPHASRDYARAMLRGTP